MDSSTLVFFGVKTPINNRTEFDLLFEQLEGLRLGIVDDLDNRLLTPSKHNLDCLIKQAETFLITENVFGFLYVGHRIFSTGYLRNDESYAISEKEFQERLSKTKRELKLAGYLTPPMLYCDYSEHA